MHFQFKDNLIPDTDGSLLICDSGNNRILRFSNPSTLELWSGSNNCASGLSGTTRANATYNFPTSVGKDSLGNYYVADSDNNLIRRISAGSNTLSTFVGGGSIEISGNPINGTSAILTNPTDLLVVGDLLFFRTEILISDRPTNVIATVFGITSTQPQVSVFYKRF